MRSVPQAVVVEGIRKTFPATSATPPVVALDRINLDFRAGAFTTLLGPSGCGKTTLLRIIAGFASADRGFVRIGDRDVTAVPPWKRGIGFCFQNYALWPHMTVYDNVAFGLRLRGTPADKVRIAVHQVLEMMGLAAKADARPEQLSGGQQQRVALARALALEPQVLLLDEPLSNLDARLRIEMRREIRRIQRKFSTTAIYVTHDQEEALEISDVIAVMSQGRIEQVDTPELVYRSPRTAFVAEFVGTVTLIRGQVDTSGSLAVDGLHIPMAFSPALANRTICAAIRPEDILVSSTRQAGSIPAIVTDRSYMGHTWRVVARVGKVLSIVAQSESRIEEGEAIYLTVLRHSVIDG